MSERLDSRAVEIFQPSDAAAVGWDILTRIREHPDLGMLSVPHPLTGIPGQYWDPLDLDHGDLGVALVFAAADELRPHDGWDHAALPYISRATDALASRVATHGTAVMGLFGGAACVAYALRALSRSGKRYRNAVTQVDNLMLDLIETHLAAVPGSGLGTDDYDIIGGLAGPTRLLLQIPRIEDRSAGVLSAAVDRLARWAVTTDGYRTPPARITPLEREHQPDLHGGYLNLGYAHGLCGVLSVLARAAERNVGGSVVHEGAERVATTIVNAVIECEHGPELPFMQPTVPVSSGGGPGRSSRIGWCYGNIGAVLAFSDYLPVAADKANIAASLERLLNSVAQTPLSLHDDNPSLCHGVGGLLLIARHFTENGLWIGSDTALNPQDLAGRVLGMYDSDLVFGLRNLQQWPLDSPGFLTGSGGAGVALASWAEGTRLTSVEKIITGGSLC